MLGMKNSKTKKRPEYSKLLAAWSLGAATVCLIVSFLLSWLDHDPCSEITIAMVTAATAVVDFYMHKSLKEKDSRNKYGIDADGNRIQTPPTDDPVG